MFVISGRPQYDGLTPDTPDLMGRRIRSACSPTHSAYRYDVMGPCHDTVLCPTICIHSASSGANNQKFTEKSAVPIEQNSFFYLILSSTVLHLLIVYLILIICYLLLTIFIIFYYSYLRVYQNPLPILSIPIFYHPTVERLYCNNSLDDYISQSSVYIIVNNK